jgi:signal transduction histidine kinase
MNSNADDLDHSARVASELGRQMDAVRRIAVGLSTATSLDELIPEALHISLSLADAEAGSILLYHPGRRKLVFEYVVGEKADELTGMELDPDQGLAGQVFQSGAAQVSEDVTKERGHLRELGEEIGYLTKNMVTVPLKCPKADPLGVMQVLNKRGGRFDEYDIRLIEIMAAQVAVAIMTVRLHEEARLATVVRFIGNISHDVKNMVTPAVTGAETLRLVADDCLRRFDERLSQFRDSGAATEQLATTLSQLRELYPEIVEMILDGCDAIQQRMVEISAAVKGIVSQPSFEPADVVAIARRIEKMLAPQARKKGVALAVECAGDLPQAVVDPKQIYNALYNLAFNAIDACDDGDTVTLRFQAQPEGAFPEGNCIIMECVDSGPGIPEHVRAKLFSDEAISTKPMGTGLGTRIVKNVVDAHRGIVEVDSEPGVGTTMRCRIPVRPQEAGARQPGGRPT